jgi:hypothetical protein
MSDRPVSAVALLLVFSLAAPVIADDFGDGNARARLVASTDVVESGGTFLLGVHLDIKPGWHIYWRNPGEAGVATEIRWRIPDGAQAGALQWPLPIGFIQSGDIPGYGYEGSVVLASEIRVADDLDKDSEVGAMVSWLACKDVCVIGSAELARPLSKVSVDPVFSTWMNSLPQAFGEEDPPFGLTTQGGLSDGKLGLWLQWRQTPRMVEWFPDPPEGLEVKNVKVQTRGGLTRIDAAVRALKGATGVPTELSSLVVATGEDGGRHGWKLSVRLEDNEL